MILRYMRKSSLLSNLLPILLGICAFFTLIAPKVLIPTNIFWLGQDDSAQHYLGWVFFRNHAWTFPLGLNPDYGLELSNSIVYSDSIPLLALLFKGLRAFLPEAFQYFGIWLLLCLVLQAFFAWKIASLISPKTLIKALITIFFVFAPPMLFRVNYHSTLVGHFLILAGLYLNLRPAVKHRILFWGSLLLITALVHAYLTAMLLLLWFSDLHRRFKKAEITVIKKEIISILILLILVIWQAGYFSVGESIGTGGFSVFSFNLLSLFNARDWSHLLPNLYHDETGEGFNFLGLGMFILFFYAAGLLLTKDVKQKFKSLISEYGLLMVFLGFLTLFALSNKLSFGPYTLELPVPYFLQKNLGTFRASGRMFWPVYYMIYISIFYIIVRKHSSRVVAVLLGMALFLQVVDTSAGWLKKRQGILMHPKAVWEGQLTGPFWQDAAKRYKKIRRMKPANVGKNWLKLSYYAAINKLATDAVYLARCNRRKALHTLREQAKSILQSGEYELDTLYVFDDELFNEVWTSLKGERDLFLELDGLKLVAPGGQQCSNCLKVSSYVCE